MAKGKSWKVDRVTVRPRGEPDGARCKVRLEWYPSGFDGRMAVRTVTGSRAEITAAAGAVIASGYAAPPKWGQPKAITEAAVLTTIGQLLAAWLYAIEETEEGSDLSPRSRVVYRQSVSRVLGPKRAPRLRNQPLETWTPAAAATWSKRRAQVNTRSTHQCDRMVLRAAWRWATRQGHIQQPNPLTGLAWPNRWGGKPHDRYTPTVGEVWATVAALRDTAVGHRTCTILTVVWATGARIGEVCALRRDDLDLADPLDGWATLQGESESTTGKCRGELAYRGAPLNPESVRLLQTHLDTMPPDQVRLWPGRLSVITESVRDAIRLACQREELPHWSPHGLRRLMVDDMIRDGIDVKTASEITGHSVVTMLRMYRKVTEADKRAAARRVRRRSLEQRQVIEFPGADEG